MSEPNTLECWDQSSSQPAPVVFHDVLRDDEWLLWAARVSSTRTVSHHLRKGAVEFVAVLFFYAIAPWNQTIDEYCGPNSSGRCEVLAYVVWPAVAFLTVSSLWRLFAAWRARYRPWMIFFGLSGKRALFMDEGRPKTLRYIYLRLHPAKLARRDSVGFEGQRLSFVGLSPEATTRALHYATIGRDQTRALSE